MNLRELDQYLSQMKFQKIGKFFIKNIEEKTILAIFAKVKLGEALTLGDKLVLEAFNRYSSSLSDLDTLKSYLSGLSEEQLMGVTSNVKGILHEIQFAAIENNNFDSVYASLYETTNHPGYDVRMFDESTGEEWDIQLKATDNSAYVEDWIEEHDGDIRVTEELAEKAFPLEETKLHDGSSHVRSPAIVQFDKWR